MYAFILQSVAINPEMLTSHHSKFHRLPILVTTYITILEDREYKPKYPLHTDL